MRTVSLYAGLLLAGLGIAATIAPAEAGPYGRGGHGGYHGYHGGHHGYRGQGFATRGYGYRHGGNVGGAIAAGILGGLLVGGLVGGLAGDEYGYGGPGYSGVRYGYGGYGYGGYGYGGYGYGPGYDPGPVPAARCRTVGRYGSDEWGNRVRYTSTVCD